jgi:hypothetical protein
MTKRRNNHDSSIARIVCVPVDRIFTREIPCRILGVRMCSGYRDYRLPMAAEFDGHRDSAATARYTGDYSVFAAPAGVAELVGAVCVWAVLTRDRLAGSHHLRPADTGGFGCPDQFHKKREALNQIHLTMNSRLDQLLKAAQAQGKVDEQDAQAIRDKLL